MRFIEMTGETLRKLLGPEEIADHGLLAEEVADASLVRVNEHGDIEVRRSRGWEVIGGLLGEYPNRLRQATGLDWAEVHQAPTDFDLLVAASNRGW